MKIGFIGLGNMGGPMAKNLAAAGHAVSGFDVAAPMPEGVTKAASAAGAANGADVVITMLPEGPILRRVADEVVPAMEQGAILLDCSTVDVESARAVAEQAVAAGLRALDAPVSGGIGGAEAGTLTFMVGGSDDAFADAKPLFEIMGQKAVPLRPLRQRPGGQDLQQHDPGRHDDRHLRGFCACRQAWPRPAGDVRRGLDLVGL